MSQFTLQYHNTGFKTETLPSSIVRLCALLALLWLIAHHSSSPQIVRQRSPDATGRHQHGSEGDETEGERCRLFGRSVFITNTCDTGACESQGGEPRFSRTVLILEEAKRLAEHYAHSLIPYVDDKVVLQAEDTTALNIK